MYGVIIAFKDFNGIKGIWGSDWAGLKHFTRFFQSPSFSKVVYNTIALSIYSILATFPIPIVLALAINSCLYGRFKKVVQMSSYAPYFISTVVLVGMMYQFFSPKFGIVNNYLKLLGIEPIMFMGVTSYFRHMYVWSDVWQNAGWGSIIYVSVLSSVDHEQHEAALIDGASRFKRLLYIEIPAIVPTIITLFILRTGFLMSVGFEKVFLMQTATNLQVSQVISTFVYQVGFSSQLPSYSYGTAIGLFNSFINFFLIMLVNSIARRFSETSIW